MNQKSKSQQLQNILLSSTILLFTTAPCIAATTIKTTKYIIPENAYFVSLKGKDSNSGKTPNAPTTVAKALAKAPAGTTIVFRGGVYRNVDMKMRKQLTLQAYPQEQVWFKGSNIVKNWVREGNRWRKDGWNYTFPSNVGKKYIDPRYPLAGYRDMVYINDVALQQVANKAQVVPGTFYVDAARQRLYIGDNPTGKTVEATARSNAITLTKSSSFNTSGTVIRGLGFAHYAERAILVLVPRVILENNTVVWNGLEGVKFGGKNVSTDAIVRGNTFSYNSIKGLGGNGAHRMLLEKNTISNNNVEQFATNWDAAGAKLTRVDGVIWRDNFIENNLAHGLWIDESSTNAIIVNNIARENRGASIFFEISNKAIIAGNIAYNNFGGIMVTNAANARIYNNTLANNIWNLRIKDTKRNNSDRQGIAAGITWITRDNIVKNNIFSNAAGSTLVEASNCDTKEPSAMMLTTDFNAYYRPISNKPRNLIKWSLGRGKCAVGYTSIAAFQAANKSEQRALVIDNIAPNPFFMNEFLGNFHLKPDSPAIARGEALPADIASFMRVKPGKPVDLGALQRS